MKFILLLLILLLTGCSNSSTNSTNQSAEPLSTSNSSTSPSTSIPPSPSPIELSTFTTTIYTKTDERQNNVKIACNDLNGKTVESGETFSFTETLGPAKPEDGYMKADSFDEDGDVIQEYGGRKMSN